MISSHAGRLSSRLRDLIDELESLEHSLTCDALRSTLERHSIRLRDVEEFVNFQDDQYCHCEIAASAYYELGCIGWLPGQESPIHDHRGCACCVQVLSGTMTNTDYTESLKASHQSFFSAGQLLVRNDRQIHRLSNRNLAGRDLVTLHLYSPPLPPMEVREQSA